jgi:DNA-directed RNA polymerase III subunit RPC2
MERDCVVGFGCAELLSERLMLSSDIFLASFDYYTGLMACEENSKQNVKIKLPYACKLLFQELRSMNITPKLNLKNKGSIFTEL